MNRAAATLWMLDRFGLTPSKLARRLGPARHRGQPAVFVTSVPKAGTHLLERALCLHPLVYRRLIRTINPHNLPRYGGTARLVRRLQPGEVLITHLAARNVDWTFSAESLLRTVFMVRDPRDIVVSQAHYIPTQPRHRHHARITAASSFDERLRLLIEGDPAAGLPGIRERLAAYAPWFEAADLVVRFEDLIGPRGGGTKESQLETLERLYACIGVPPPPGGVEQMAARMFSQASPTFRRGEVGGWRTTVDSGLVRSIELALGDLLERYGYVAA